LDLAGIAVKDASALTLAGSTSEATNSIVTMDAVAPVLTPEVPVRNGSTYTVPANGIVVLTLRTK
jgi:hypothetical protein